MKNKRVDSTTAEAKFVIVSKKLEMVVQTAKTRHHKYKLRNYFVFRKLRREILTWSVIFFRLATLKRQEAETLDLKFNLMRINKYTTVL